MKIAITIGDANGIGIEVMLKALSGNKYNSEAEFEFYGSSNVLYQWIKLLKFPAKIKSNFLEISGLKIRLYGEVSDYVIQPGEISSTAGGLAGLAIESAVSDALDKKIDAIVTLPITKESMYLSGWKFPGHTEMLASQCKVNSPLMILFKDNLRAALVTIHKPLKLVAKHITIDSVFDSIAKFNISLKKDFGISEPKIAVLGLNPHAGENGNIGSEEIDVIIPAIIQAKIFGIDCDGPFPADGFFAHKDYKNYDGYLAMYHDQGLIPLKLLAGGGGVNFTAGLPIVRTSPDHGTAYAIAGKGIADEQSTVDAINAAIDIVNSRINTKF